jgi:hypothetical protein
MTMQFRSLAELAKARKSPEELLGGLTNVDSPTAAQDAAKRLVMNAKAFGVEMRDYLRLVIDPTKSNQAADYDGLNGYEAALKYLNLPVKDDFDNGITLDLASDTFEFLPGTRVLFPEVIDDLVRWKYRQDQFERTENIVAGSRTIAGAEMIMAVVNDTQDDYTIMRPVAELSNIKVHSIQTSQQTVRMFKLGGGYKTSYEFSRRARLDLLTPYANRLNRELDRSKVALATSILINGDGVNAAAPVVNQSSFDASVNQASTANKINYQSLLAWFVARAKAGTPVDTVVGNWDAYIQWLLMFAVPIANAGFPDSTAAENMARAGFKAQGVPLMDGTVNFAISSTAPENQIIGITKGETIEELIEAGSLISEAERAPLNQSITYLKTETSGYRLAYSDTRSIYNYAA